MTAFVGVPVPGMLDIILLTNKLHRAFVMF